MEEAILFGTLKYIDAKLIYGRHVTNLKRFKSFYYGYICRLLYFICQVV